MKLSDIIRQVNVDTSQTYTNQSITDWCNRCLDELTSIRDKQKKTSYTINDTNSYSLPDDLYKINYLVINTIEYDQLEANDFVSQGYKTFDGSFSLQAAPTKGTIDLYYVRTLAHLDASKLDGEPEIEEPFHDLLVLYATSMSQYQEEEPQKQADAFARYMNRLGEYKSYRNRQRPVKSVRVVRAWC